MVVTTVVDLKREAKENAKKKIRLYNPDTEDFSVKYGPNTHTIKSLDSEEFQYTIAIHVKRHLVNHLINKRQLGIYSPLERKEIEDEVEMKI